MTLHIDKMQNISSYLVVARSQLINTLFELQISIKFTSVGECWRVFRRFGRQPFYAY